MPVAWHFVGLSMLAASGFILYKHKKARKYFIIALVALSSGVSTANAQQVVRHIGDRIFQNATQGGWFAYAPERKVDGYCYVGYIVLQEDEGSQSTTEESVTETTTKMTTETRQETTQSTVPVTPTTPKEAESPAVVPTPETASSTTQSSLETPVVPPVTPPAMDNPPAVPTTPKKTNQKIRQ